MRETSPILNEIMNIIESDERSVLAHQLRHWLANKGGELKINRLNEYQRLAIRHMEASCVTYEYNKVTHEITTKRKATDIDRKLAQIHSSIVAELDEIFKASNSDVLVGNLNTYCSDQAIMYIDDKTIGYATSIDWR